MKALPDWIHWTVMYIGLAGLFLLAQGADEITRMAFPAVSILRSLGIVYVAFIMTSAWVEQRTMLFTTYRLFAEILIAVGLYYSGAPTTAIVSLLALAVYELARKRVTYY